MRLAVCRCFGGADAVCRQDLVDDRGDGAELGAARRLGTPVARRHREGQHLAYGIAVDPKAPRRLALAQTLDMAGVANPSVELHREHPRPLRPAAHEPKEGNDPVQFCTGAAGLSGRLSGTLSQCRSHQQWDGFYGLKLHFVINHKGQIMALKITPGNTADSTVLDEMTRHLAGKLYADKGYIGRELFHKLWRRGLHLITSIRRNMRNYLMPLADKVMLRKRFVIETVLDTLKSEMGLEHSRHRSVINAMVHVLSCLVAYAFRPGKPSISLTARKITAYP